jgi:hypothetical protein
MALPWGAGERQDAKQIPGGNDRKKSKGKGNDNRKGNDNGNSNRKGNDNGNSNRRSFDSAGREKLRPASLRMTTFESG